MDSILGVNYKNIFFLAMFIRIFFLSFMFSHLSPQSIYVVKLIEFEICFHIIVFPLA